MLKSIYSSKLYVASSRRDRINSTMLNIGNYELVQQLATDLNEEFRTPENLGQLQLQDNSSNEEDSFLVNEKIDPENDLVTMNDLSERMSSKSSGGHSPSPAKFTEHKDDEGPEPEENTDELIPESPANEKPAKEEQPAEASTKITSTTIIKPEQLVNIDVLKGTLNAREDLAGVLRTAVKEKEQEIWIYYNDNVNLNNIMVEVIEFVKNAGFDVLEFNRLARSDNAIVFSIAFQSARELKSIGVEEEK